MPLKIGNDFVTHLKRKIKEWSYYGTSAPSGVVPEVLTGNPEGTICKILGSYGYNPTSGNYYECTYSTEDEVLELKDNKGNLIHRRTTINYNANEGVGNVPASALYTWGVESIPNPTSSLPTRTAYTLNGWNYSGVGTGLTFPVLAPEEDSTLYALWKPINYTVTFNKNGGSGGNSSASYNIEDNNTIASKAGNITKAGYYIYAWKLYDFSGGHSWGPVNTSYLPANTFKDKYGNITLRADWSGSSYNVELIKGAGISSLTGLTSYSTSSSLKNYTVNRTKGSSNYYYSTPTINRVGFYGGSMPTISGHTISGSSFTVNIPAESYGEFKITQKAFYYARDWSKIAELLNDEIDTYPGETGQFISGGVLQTQEEIFNRDNRAKSAISGYFGATQPPEGTIVTVYFEEMLTHTFIFTIWELAQTEVEVT